MVHGTYGHNRTTGCLVGAAYALTNHKHTQRPHTRQETAGSECYPMTLTAKQYADHWGDFLMGYQWTLFGTLTTRFPIREPQLITEFMRWIRKIDRHAQGAVNWHYAIEPHSCGTHLHLHFLLNAPPCISPTIASALWKLGRVDAERFDPNRGAAYYISKANLHNPDRYDISKRLPPRWPSGLSIL